MKRVTDIILSVITLPLCLIPIISIIFAIVLLEGFPVFFIQIRIGCGMHSFRMYQFRTMRMSTENNNLLTVGNDARITTLGHWLRKYHLDELPQLLNIIIGDMSFIGPRPEIPEFVDPNNPMQCEVLTVRPGLFDSATLYWINEAQILGQVEHWQEYYRRIILPDKLSRSLNDIKNRSVKTNLSLLKQLLYLFLFHRLNKKYEDKHIWHN